MELKGTAINFLGDSITEGSGTSGLGKKFTDVLAREYEIIAFNYGIGGTRIAKQHNPSQEAKFDRDFCSRVAELEESADAVVVFGGTNDFGHGDAPMGSFTDCTSDTFYGALHVLYSSLITKFPGKPIVIVTPLHRTEEVTATKALIDYVRAIREVAEYYSLPVLDLYAESGLQPNVPIIKQMNVPDGLHPNDAGHEIIAKKIANFMLTL